MLARERIANDQRPVILLLGAQRESTKQHLTAVQKELTGLKAIFEPYEKKHHTLFRLEYDPDLTQAELKGHLDQLAGKLSILHFAGHSDGETLQTDDLQVYAERIADIIKVWTSPPDLIFLNGCHNEGQVDAFHSAGVPVVIATSQKVNDATAADFACEFYKSLVGSDEVSLQAAFVTAKQKMQLSSPNELFSVHLSPESKEEQEVDENDRSPNLATVHKPIEQVALPWLLYAQTAEQENWTLGRLLTQERPVLGDDRQPVNPYKGLASFTEKDKKFFFGRESLVNDLTKNIKESPLVTLLGASGSGKSSLINAGVIPKLTQEVDWNIVSVKPGNAPFAELSAGLCELYSTTGASLEELQLNLKQEKGVLNFFTEHLTSQEKVLLLIDQFEELFTQSSPEVVEAFQQQLYELVEANLANLHVVLVMRADFLSDALQNANFARLLNRNLDKKLAPMDQAELRAAINNPAANQRVGIEPILLETLLNSVENQAGSLPLLQDILHQLWEHRSSRNLITLNEYNQLGGLKKALENRADNILKGLSVEHQQVVKEIFLRLIQTRSGANDARRRAYSREFKDNPVAEKILQQLVKERLVMAHQADDGEAYFEISHETLITNWGSLREWIESDRANINLRNQLSKATKDWEDHKKDSSWLMTGSRLIVVEDWLKEQSGKPNNLEKMFINTSINEREKGKKRRYSIVSGVIITLSLVASIAVWQWYKAKEESIRANEESTRAINQINTANKLIDNIQGDLRDKLQKINQLDIMSGVQAAVAKYHADSENIVKGTKSDLFIKRDRDNVRNKIDGADILFKKGEIEKSFENYKSALYEIKRISDLIPNDTKWKSNISLIYLKMALLNIDRKKYQEAQDFSQKALGITRKLLVDEPNNSLLKRDVISAYDSFGMIYDATWDFVQAIEYRNLALQEIDSVIKLEPNNIDHAEFKIFLISRISSTYSRADDILKMKKIIDSDPSDESVPGELIEQLFKEKKKTISFPCIDNCLNLAIDGHVKSFLMMRKLVENNPDNNLLFQKFVIICQEVTDAYYALGDIDNYSKYYKIFEKNSNELLLRNPGHSTNHVLVAQSHFSKGTFYRESNKFDLAKDEYLKGLLIMEKLIKNNVGVKGLQIEFNAQLMIYNGLDASKKTYELLKEAGMEK